jgi:hypothetical protein
MESANTSWSFFEKVYCISLRERSDRRRQVNEELARVDLQDRVELHIVERHPLDRAQGIFESHMQCIQRGLERGAGNILIFEDDVFSRSLDPSIVDRVCRALQERPGWNALFLGCITSAIRNTGMPGVSEIDYRCLAHAYALNTPFARRITGETWKGIPIDDLLRRKCTNFFAISPMCAFQGLAGTDNQTDAINRLRTIFGGLSFIQSANKLYQGHKVAIVAAHLSWRGPSSFWSVAPGRVPR